ncbi:ATP-binding domain-containing protein [Glycomyces sp. TRM65418]|uniref:HelD family protein n=1 Tax=Glycomyces sp. TRM65418 TaxID=2867006 RepID=UPI001CE4D0A4|nr:ATP-binding domain-containing protein [Glycomyces sp. TRM65418]MCC3762147.1 ATP-binding domain-containing protein [Glycomyces sp. TRM65418]QZD56211.1 ATP-binding domain-containing protein [Glycomyces sp. TRM65418]
MSAAINVNQAVQYEQARLNGLYARLDRLRDEAAERLDESRRKHVENEQERSQRDAETHLHRRRIAQLDAVEEGLCFGRLDYIGDEAPMYLGRIGVHAEGGEQLLVDWRSEAGRRFYLATAAAPAGVRRRRHLHTRGRRIRSVNDEVLDLEAAGESGSSIGSEGALMAALDAARTGTMQDIVATIQAEQDRIIRAPLEGVMIVDGAPGTGKTAVALHRAAYLLYEHREQLKRRGVLIIGPGKQFLRYISEVLPGLAETDVLLRTPAQLFPGVVADRPETDAVAAVKGRAVMAGVIASAVADRQVVPRDPVPIDYEGHELYLRPEKITAARDAARETGLPHNEARETFHKRVIADLATQYADIIGEDPLGGENLLGLHDRAKLAAEIATDPVIRGQIEVLWPELTPQELLEDLFASRERIASAAAVLKKEERALLLREPGGWSEADVALLDEAAEHLGEIEVQQRGGGLTAEQIAYAQDVLTIAAGSASFDFEDEESEILQATDVIDEFWLGERQVDDVFVSVAERAAADRRWIFGHVIVDEAQELSPMEWRALLRRCVTRSFTVAGDLAQATGAAALGGEAPSSWAEVFGDSGLAWRAEQLTVSYRTPAEIMEVAVRVLDAIDVEAARPRSVRESGHRPWLEIAADGLDRRVEELVAAEKAAVGEGSVAIVTTPERAAGLSGVAGAAVLTVKQAKGLEFDSVIVVDPDAIAASGLRNLYVALTRATKRLGVVAPDKPDFPGAELL